MEPYEFRAVLDLAMRSDPWPHDETNHSVFKSWLNREARARGFADWVDAYHRAPNSVDAEAIQGSPLGFLLRLEVSDSAPVRYYARELLDHEAVRAMLGLSQEEGA